MSLAPSDPSAAQQAREETLVETVVGSFDPCPDPRLREVLESLRVPHSGATIATTASFGVTSVEPGAREDVEAVLKRADRALYRAKDQGRNRVEMAA